MSFMRLEKFDKLQTRDFENGAVLDDIRETIKLAEVCHLHGAAVSEELRQAVVNAAKAWVKARDNYEATPHLGNYETAEKAKLTLDRATRALLAAEKGEADGG